MPKRKFTEIRMIGTCLNLRLKFEKKNRKICARGVPYLVMVDLGWTKPIV